jgi:multiple sugar transport system permease protein
MNESHVAASETSMLGGPGIARGFKTARHREAVAAYLLLVPSVLYLLVMSLYPMAYSLWLAFRNYLIYRPDRSSFAGVDNFIEQLHSEVFWQSLGVTLKFAAASVTIEFGIGLLVAMLLNRRMRGMGILRTLLVIPVLVSPVAMGLTFRYLYAPNYGLVNYMLQSVGLPRLDWIVSTTWALPAVIFVDLWQWTPFVVLILLSGMQSVPLEIIEAAELDGLNAWQHLRRILLPLIRPVVLVVLLIRLIDSIRSFDLIYVLTRGGPATATYLLSIHTYIKGFTGGDMGTAAAVAWMIVILVNILAVIFLRLLARGQA